MSRSATHHGTARLSPADQRDLDGLARLRGIDGTARILGVEVTAIDPLVWGGVATQRRVDTVARALAAWRAKGAA